MSEEAVKESSKVLDSGYIGVWVFFRRID